MAAHRRAGQLSVRSGRRLRDRRRGPGQRGYVHSGLRPFGTARCGAFPAARAPGCGRRRDQAAAPAARRVTCRSGGTSIWWHRRLTWRHVPVPRPVMSACFPSGIAPRPEPPLRPGGRLETSAQRRSRFRLIYLAPADRDAPAGVIGEWPADRPAAEPELADLDATAWLGPLALRRSDRANVACRSTLVVVRVLACLCRGIRV